MKNEKPAHGVVPGFKHFFSPRSLDLPDLSVRGIGVREMMPPCWIVRPRGTADYLFMLFHDEAVAGAKRDDAVVQPPESMMIWPSNKPQFYGHATQKYCHTWIHCEGARVRRIIRSAGLPLLQPFVVPNPFRFEQCLLEVHRELVSYAHPDPVIAGNLLENGLRDLARARSGEARSIPLPEGLLRVRQLIGEAPARRITLNELAVLAGMSVPSLCVRFKEAFGLSPIECLIQHRMHHAAHLLANPQLTIQEIARQVGYDDPFHFSKLFKKHFGYGPREARRRISAG